MKKTLLCLAVLASQPVLADVVSPMSGAGWTLTCQDQTPTVTTTYSMGGDAGLPGLLYVALKLPGTNLPQAPLFQNTNAGWESFTGGLAPVRTIYRTALPASDTIKITLPGNPTSTVQYVGWEIWVGNGALTLDDQAKVQMRRDTLNQMKPERVAAGTWRPEYDDDDHFRRALVQTNMQKRQKYQRIVTLPMLDCSPN